MSPSSSLSLSRYSIAPCPSLFSQVAFDKLTVDSANQQANAAVAAATAADQQAGFDIRMAKAEHDAGGMKVRDGLAMVITPFSSLMVYCTLAVGAFP